MLHNARVLSADWVPRDVVHRNAEKNRLRNALQPVLDDEPPEDIFIDGPSGAGKTCLSRFTTRKLEEQTFGVHTHYVDCWQHSTKASLLMRVLEGVDTTHDIHPKEGTDKILDRLSTVDEPYVTILDEADQIQDSGILRQLWSIPKLTLILIANRERDVLDPLDERLRSRLRGAVSIHFDKYSHAELVAILKSRADAALEPQSINESELDVIADKAAGNARDAISYLRQSAREADWEGDDTITREHIQTAIPAAQDSIRRHSLSKLNDDQRVVYEVLDDLGCASPKEIYEVYVENQPDPRSKRTVRKYLKKLVNYNLAEVEGAGPSRVYTAVNS